MTLEEKLKRTVIRIDLGSGNVNMRQPLDEWIRIDAVPLDNVDIVCNFIKIDLPDGCADEVWMGDSIEHIRVKDYELVLAEVNRILKQGGVFGGTTPNLNAAANRYVKGELSFHDFYGAIYGSPEGEWQQHYSTFTAFTLSDLLKNNGFGDVDLSESPGSNNPMEAWWLRWKCRKVRDAQPLIPYIGDLSRQDAHLLKWMASQSLSILEFGVGGSTQLLAKYQKEKGTMISLDTSMDWIVRTEQNMKLLGINREIRFEHLMSLDIRLPSIVDKTYDFIFDDGVDSFRLDFALKTWRLLRIGGTLALHDTRRSSDMKNVLAIIEKFSPEIESVQINARNSNMTLIKKKKAEFYENWNETEGREPGESGYADVDIEKLKAKLLQYEIHGR